ncbi:uncharacterized protein LOC107371561 isoform X2 [Tetranychus urticae]|uniref:uncharacterized protein LOC107371561 isoform X2 n=1 Tax=Tetranychus urticae TaxID=32264 RepID=UPI000D641BB1|nr:uncharacterized protein LOC107371561 isoform X2 [Tetranychus urticae]
MFPSKYFASIFIVSYFFIKSSAGGNHQPNGLEQFFEDQTNFLIKAKLSYEGSEKVEWLIKESVFGDEKNSIVTSITQESGGSEIKVFRDFKTQIISLICFQNNCDRYEKFWHLNLKGIFELLATFFKQILLMGPYRIISYFANETTNEVYINDWDIEGFSQFKFKFRFSDPNSRILMRRKNSGQIKLEGFSDTGNHTSLMAVLSIIQIEPLQSSMVPLPFKYIHYKFNESITRYNGTNTITANTTNQHTITLLGSASSLKIIGEQSYREVIHDYEFGSKYISSGFNECTMESINKKIDYMTSEKYGIEFVKELYFPESYVESFSSKLGIKAEYNKLVDNVEYDLAVTTYSRPVLELYESSRSRMNITDILKDFCLLLNLYSKSGSHEFDLIEVRKKCFIDVLELSAEDEWLQMITNMDNACFKDRNDKIILHLKILFLDRSVPRKIRDFSSHIQNIKHELRRMIMDKLSISYLRINQIKLDFFNAYTIMAKVEIVESFVTHLKTKIQGTALRFRIKSTGSGIYSSTIDECVRLQGSKAKNKFIITCKTGDYLCLGIDHENSLPAEDTNGLNCMLFNISTTNLSIDVSLKEIRKSYRNLNGSLFYAFRGSAFVVFGVTDVSPVKPASNIFSKYFYLLTIFLFTITIIFCLIMILLCKLCKHKIHVLVDSVSLEALNSRK